MKHHLLKQVLGFPEQEDRLSQLLSHVKLVLAVRYITGPSCSKGEKHYPLDKSLSSG